MLVKFCQSPAAIGAIAPSSAFLAREMVRHVGGGQGRRYLEIGPGSGAFTRQLVDRLGPGDQLDLVECDPTYVQLLTERFANNQVTVHHQSILTWDPLAPYDVVLSGLPLAAFQPDEVAAILAKYQQLVKPDGVLTYFEYVVLPTLMRTFLLGQSRRRIHQVLSHKADFVARFAAPGQSARIYRNLPPARVVHCHGNWLKA